MLTEPTPARERAEAAHQMGAATDRILRQLKQLTESVRKVRAAMPPPQDPVSLDQLMTSRDRAMNHARHAAATLAAGQDGGAAAALADVHELIEEIRGGVASDRILNDVTEMFVEASRPSDQRALNALETRMRRLLAEADRLFALAVAAQQDLPSGAQPMSQPIASPQDSETWTDRSTAKAVREVGEIIAATLAGAPSATPPPRPADRRFAAVADQMIASLQSLGMPYDGIGLPSTDDPDRVRSQIIEGLQRNFSSREEDGTRVYFRSAPQAVSRDPNADSRLLRGSALVNANLLRAEADGVLAIIDRLPDMLRFVPVHAQPRVAARARLRGLLDQLVATASDPLGLNARRGRFQFERLSAAVLEILRNGEIISSSDKEPIFPLDEAKTVGKLWETLASGEERVVDRLRNSPSVVRAEELSAEIVDLGKLMVSMYDRVAKAPSHQRGVLAGRLEELLIAVDGAAASLESELARFGSTSAEQELQFFGTAMRGDVSVAQFIGWARALCAPYLGAENIAAGLSVEELRILHDELVELSASASSIAEITPVGFGGVRRQFAEFKSFIDSAAECARQLAA